jgi:erythrocyte band 7 integral membrane protein
LNDLGIYVEQIFIKDMMIAKDLQRDLSMTSKTERLSKAKIISAEADVKSAKLMHQASDILNSKAAMQIRYLEILQAIAKGGGQKIMFLPLSSEEFDQ